MAQFELTPTQSQQGTCTPHKTKPVLKTSQFRPQIWSLATQKTRRRPQRSLSFFPIFSCLVRLLLARNILTHSAAPYRVSEGWGIPCTAYSLLCNFTSLKLQQEAWLRKQILLTSLLKRLVGRNLVGRFPSPPFCLGNAKPTQIQRNSLTKYSRNKQKYPVVTSNC